MFISKIKIAFTLLITILAIDSYGQSNDFKVTLDAGHGDHDFGAVYSGRIEKNIALAIVLKVGKILEAQPKFDVIYTRKTDVFVDLVERANIANRANSHIFVSIHCNANRNTAADGTETYVMGMNKIASNLEAAKKENSVITLEKDYKRKYEGFDPNSPETMIGMTLMQEEYLENSISLASKVEEKFALLGKKLRHGGVKQAPFMVLHKAYMPRVLIETGFVSNPTEGDLLNSEEGQNDIAKAIADAIISYKLEFFGDGEVENVGEKPSQILKENTEKVNDAPVNDNKVGVKDAAAESIFKIQFLASQKKIALEPRNFKGLQNVSIVYEDNIYKYLYGETSDYEKAKNQLSEVKSKGYDSAFMIAFKNGKKISIQEATK
ncbi:N-acetylmuramoyl-L-alanine amidase family protein [Flavobacterium gilvum]|uniref:N-acetylmuramoyl-L-alanine amidase n=1 Tax=Flavobacterium gilvum TaxID=1492737 RepID=A0AAC9I8W8_9FLAO|nr:N-acetylmuramoyl-L-alanine amidase [Flavobacterium gilvum]AOW10427.1 N-acetylmuramoyl-L-alanine amidase [Flavobacterium gilvum]KFC59056.1 N-acetylmuramoyl-L-alanine amidase [Flavobacterium gilvum]